MIVIVVGMHCSGTSAVAGLLHRHGVVMGEDDLLVPAQIHETPASLFENPRFRILNDRIAERQGYVVESWNPEIPPCRPGAITRLRMRRLIRNYEERHRVWGFEDPRSCLTLDAWLREIERVAALEDTKIVYTVRDPDAVAHSMVARNGIDIRDRAAAVEGLQRAGHEDHRRLAPPLPLPELRGSPRPSRAHDRGTAPIRRCARARGGVRRGGGLGVGSALRSRRGPTEEVPPSPKR